MSGMPELTRPNDRTEPIVIRIVPWVDVKALDCYDVLKRFASFHCKDSGSGATIAPPVV